LDVPWGKGTQRSIVFVQVGWSVGYHPKANSCPAPIEGQSPEVCMRVRPFSAGEGGEWAGKQWGPLKFFAAEFGVG